MPKFERIIPLFAYEDVQAAHDFLVKAFGFEAGGVMRNAEGQPVHGEVRIGDTTIWLHRAGGGLSSPLAANAPTSGIVVHVDDVDAHFRRAQEAGARTDAGPADRPYGQREYGARYSEGHQWWFATPVRATAQL